MCGIAGFYGFTDNSLAGDFSTKLQHRGPDGEGVYSDAQATLISRRLSIIDVAGGRMPIYNEDKSMVIVYNGEIYNYQELKAELVAAGHKFKTKGDTEVILHGYEEWGDECFERLNGMFGVALYDIKHRRLVLVRDHFGIKPVYYAQTPENHVLFASEITPIFESGRIKKAPNDRVIYRYLRYRIHEDSRETFFKGIYKLMPGQMMIVEGEQITTRYYTKLREQLTNSRVSSKPVTGEEIAAFDANLRDSVRRRLVSEVPVGTCLSGGLDSSTMAAMVNIMMSEKVAEAQSVGASQNIFSAVFPDSSNDEERYVDAVLAKYPDITAHKVYPKPEEFMADLEDFVRTQEEPTISTGPYAQYKVMQAAQGHVKVLLDGQGADEMMAGYLPYYFVYLRQLKNQRQYVKLIQEIMSSRDVVVKYARLKVQSMLSRTLSVQSMLNHDYARKYASETFQIQQSDLKKRLIEDIFSNSLPSLLRYEDKNTMRFSIEGRVPFLDVNLMRYIFTLPDEAIIRGGWNKYILRRAVDRILPQSITARRNKIGFTTPEEEWFLRMKNRIYSIFLSESFSKRAYFNQGAVVSGFEQFIQGKTHDTLLFWRILNVEMWLRCYFDQHTQKVVAASPTSGMSVGDYTVKPIKAGDKNLERLMIKTDVFKKDDDVAVMVRDAAMEAVKKRKDQIKGKWYVVVSEKVVAISQGRSYFIWDIKPSIPARILSKYVTRTPYGIGLGSPWTMQLAIGEVGLPRILLAAALSAITKPLRLKGVFYYVTGRQAAAIDGPTEYSLYPSNVSAKLAPRDPEGVAEQIDETIVERLKRSKTLRPLLDTFAGVAIIDSNDIGRNVLGNGTEYSDREIEAAFADNPMGQGTEQTPVAIVVEK